MGLGNLTGVGGSEKVCYLRRLGGEALGNIYAALLLTWTSAKKEEAALLRELLLYSVIF